jgi:hypothetical protein
MNSETKKTITKSHLNHLDSWEETAIEMANNMEYYRDTLIKIGEIIGKNAFIADDGSVSDSVLIQKLPDLVLEYRKLIEEMVSDFKDIGWTNRPIYDYMQEILNGKK